MKTLLAPLVLLPLLALAPPNQESAPVPGGLDWQVGTWEGTRRDAGDGSEEPMTMTVERILGGAGQTRVIEIPHSGGVYRGFSVLVFDPGTEVWRLRYVNDVRRTFAAYEGRVDDARSVWESVTPGRTRESSLVSERPEPDVWVRTMTVSRDGGATWSELFVDRLERTSR
jgi:hypothetical protein